MKLRDLKRAVGRLAVVIMCLVVGGLALQPSASAVEDSTPPVIGSVAFSPATVDLSSGNTDLYAEATVTDDLSGAYIVFVSFVTPSGGHQYFYLTEYPAPGHWESGFTLDPWTTETGIWVIDGVHAVDRAGNEAIVTTADLVAAGWPTQLTITDGTEAFSVTAFASPIDVGVTNVARAGKTIPVKWRAMVDGMPVDDPGHFVSITSSRTPSGELPPGMDAVEVYAGQSGLQYLGDGWWQFNWKVPKDYQGQARLMTLELSDGSTHTAYFVFK